MRETNRWHRFRPISVVIVSYHDYMLVLTHWQVHRPRLWLTVPELVGFSHPNSQRSLTA